MTKFLVAGLVLLAQQAVAEESVTLSFGYQPSSIYQIEHESRSQTKMQLLAGAEDVSSSIDLKMPADLKIIQTRTQSIETGEKDSSGVFPITVVLQSSKTYVSVDGADYVERVTSADQLQGISFHGEVQVNGETKPKSFTGEGLTAEMESLIQTVFDGLVTSNLLADKVVKVGQTVPMVIPLRIPVGELGVVNIEIETLYTLVDVMRGVANFDVSSKVLMSTELENANYLAEGSGDGEMLYDLANKISPVNSSRMDFTMKIPIEDYVLNFSSATDSVVRTSVKRLQ